MPGVLDRPCLYFMQVPVQGLKPRLERGLQESLRRLRFTRQPKFWQTWRDVFFQDSWRGRGAYFQPS